MQSIVLSATDRYCVGLRHLRHQGFYHSLELDDAEDEFDQVSTHIVCRLDDQIVGTVRLTRHPLSPLKSWGFHHDGLPAGVGVVEVCRASVDQSVRGLGLYKLIMLEASVAAKEMSCLDMIAGIEPHFPLRSWLAQIGWNELPGEEAGNNPPHGIVVAKLIHQELGSALPTVLEQRTEHHTLLKSRGYEVTSVLEGLIDG